MKSRGKRELGEGMKRRGERVRWGTMRCSCGKEKQELVLQEREDTGRNGGPCTGVRGWHLQAQGVLSTHLWPPGDRQVQRRGGGGCGSCSLPSELSMQRDLCL